MKKRESILWQRIKKNCTKPHLIRVESNTINGIPDINGCWAGKEFWMELKSDKHRYPKLSKWQISWINKRVLNGGIVLICNEALSQRCLELYRPLTEILDPRKLKPAFVFPMKVNWSVFQDALWEILEQPSPAREELKREQRFINKIQKSTGSITDVDLAQL